ncbi:MAG: sterol carrier protein domain-containing protein, partial [Muribaculaceae bacterium]|nr:sterol carrier protein domain-containing protein [Muribaculaceae bacterium]
INLTDSLLAENSGVYLIDGGRCSRSDQSVKADLEVDVSTLAAILFSNHHMGALFGIPARRPYMALMLD